MTTVGHWWLTHIILATEEAEIRSEVQGQPRQKVLKTPSQKYTAQKRAGGVAQKVKCLTSKHKVLSSGPVPQKKGRKKKDNLTGEDSFL
jgi:hypothetical protein